METTTHNLRVLWRLFAEFFKIALFVVGGGYAIIVVADDVFGKKLKWTREGELLEHLPVFQMVPGLIAGNTAIYVGLKMAGRLGAAVALSAVALPSLAVFTAVACGYNALPLGNPWIESAFLGLRSSLFGIILGTVAKGWAKSVKGAYGYIALGVATALLVGFGIGTVAVLVAAMGAGIALEYCGLGDKAVQIESAGIALEPLSTARRLALLGGVALVAALATLLYGRLFWFFVKFGLICFGGGFVLIPAYMDEFVGPDAPLIQLPEEEFSNLMALTQMTPGPVSVNSATFFGYRIGGIPGAIVATAGLLIPSLLLLTAVLTGLEKWKVNRVVRGLLRGVKPATTALMIAACLTFGGMSAWTRDATGGFSLNPFAITLAAFSAYALLRRKMSVMAAIFTCAAIGVAAHALSIAVKAP